MGMSFRLLCVFLVGLLVTGSFPSLAQAKSAGSGKKYFREFSHFRGGTHDGTLFDGTVLRLNPQRLKNGTDSTGRYNNGDYLYGRWTSPVIHQSYLEAIASWQGKTPLGTWMDVELRALVDGVWTKWYSMGVWHEHDSPFKRHSVQGQGDSYGTVATDTLVLKKAASAIQARVTLFTTRSASSPVLRGLGISFAHGFDTPGQVPHSGIAKALDVPMRSQMVFPDGGEVWCSPTSTSMVMAYWSDKMNKPQWNQTVPTVVNKVWDTVYDGAGNWPFNTAYAASMGLEAKVVRFSSLAEVEKWIEADVPVIASIAYKSGELTGSPIEQSNGHLLVIRGFTPNGDVLANDPAGPSDNEVRFTYKRLEFEKAFLNHSNGTAYLIYPQGWDIPDSNGSW